MEFKKSMSQKLRMDGRDYSRPGWCFVTLGADYHKHLFGSVKNGEMEPNALGQLVEQCWDEIPQHYGHISLGARQIMPNHFHGLVQIVRPGGKGLGEVMNVFKGAVTRKWRKSRACSESSRYSEKEQNKKMDRVWAPNYYDVICFNANELKVRERYIQANPKRWALRDVPRGVIKQSQYIGETKLLQQTGKCRALRISRKATDIEITQLKNELAAYDGVICSTFFSPGERTCLKTLLRSNAQIIWVLPMTMPEKIPVVWTDAFLQKRALWLSAFPELQSATRMSCKQANSWVEQLCKITGNEV
ncbi:MAG: hypothetical protein PHO37_07145 [Kiritimatiellae bacterium]|nr:hypothetical protein [Kiritimatiellia bacterium]